MTVSVTAGLAIQAIAVWLMHVGVRGQWMRHVGALFFAAAVAYHGVTEIMQWAWPDPNNSYRRFTSQSSLDDWVLLASICLLVYAAAYVCALRQRRPTLEPSIAGLARLNPWWLLGAAAPFLVLTAIGSTATSYRNPSAGQSASDYVVGGLAGQFLIPLVGLAGATFVARYGTRFLLPVLAAQGIVLALGGQRRSIVFAAIITLYGLSMSGIRLPRKAVAIGLIAGGLLIVTISATRAVAGREEFGAGQNAQARATGLLDGGDALSSSSGWDGVRNDTVYRLDGNSFGAIVDAGLGAGVQPVGLVTVWDTLRLCVPSFLWPNKLDLPLERRNEETYIILRFSAAEIDYIPGVFGSLAAFLGRAWLPVAAVVLGLAFAALDFFLLRRGDPARLTLGAGMVVAVLLYEQGPAGLILSARGALVLFAIVGLIFRVRGRTASAAARPLNRQSVGPLGSEIGNH